MHPLPSNDELCGRLDGIYLGNANIASELQWTQARRCLILMRKPLSAAQIPPPIMLHGCFKIVRNPFYLFPNGGFNSDHHRSAKTSDKDAMGKTNTSAWLERVLDPTLLGYEDFPMYISNLKALEALVCSGQKSQYSIITDGGSLGHEVQVIHRMFKKRLKIIMKGYLIALTKTQRVYKLTNNFSLIMLVIGPVSTSSAQTSGSKKTASRVNADQNPNTRAVMENIPGPPHVYKNQEQTPLGQIIGLTETGPHVLVLATPSPKGKSTESDDSESDLKGLIYNDEESDKEFLTAEFRLEHWSMSNINTPIRDCMVESKGWLTNPLRCEGKHATFTANIGEVIVLKEPEVLPSY
ncbi:uncharacterized protein EI90DRAFT_3018100 [Cantharellus anzutake]|uniref:uncharacterized protein n=1 Tax=Cantharellus anzutake TaxID=1750568 RepID=UPI001908C937|nr:uncharacterized protein EI90DRAFT_3018100 [Cantharellus anzutake]KAF8327608.1 hypothetical protein EI90DRAFT_3018100 [Cantharellus anzutake]